MKYGSTEQTEKSSLTGETKTPKEMWTSFGVLLVQQSNESRLLFRRYWDWSCQDLLHKALFDDLNVLLHHHRLNGAH
jgi:hypothetical protein